MTSDSQQPEKNPVMSEPEPADKQRPPLRLLALEPYFAGSHQAFLEGWIARSRHDWTVLSLAGHHWKWRMRHAAATFAEQLQLYPVEGFVAIFTTSMLNLAEFRGLADPAVRDLPAVVYFHENQLTYPVRREDERDLHFAVSHVMTLRAADAVWFNSGFHKDSFAEALARFVRRMPDDSLGGSGRLVAEKGLVQPPGIDVGFRHGARRSGPMRILWAARWEFDKNPERFFRAIRRLEDRGADFRLSVLGPSYSDVPAIFEDSRRRFANRIDHWGYQATHEAYRAVLEEADVVVSTADHEFFGIAIAEAIAAGAYPLLPRRLSYPELLAPLGEAAEAFFYETGEADGESEDRLAEVLLRRIDLLQATGTVWPAGHPSPVDAIRRFDWSLRAAAMDAGMENAAMTRSGVSGLPW